MSESTASRTGGESAEPQVSAGSLLRQGREAAGLHVAALAVALKVPVHRLEALEADRHDLLPDAVFIRGLASSVCRTLKMDAASVLALLPAPVPPRLGSISSRSQDSYMASSGGRSWLLLRSLPKPVAGAAAALLFAALALVVWPLLPSEWRSSANSAFDGKSDVALTDAPLAGAARVEGAALGAPTVEAATATSALQAALQTAPAQPPLGLAPVAAAPAPAAASPVAPLASPVKSAPATLLPALSTDVVVFRASAASWVEVTDAKGTVVMRRELNAGEAVGASGVAPLSVVVGRADATQVQVRGQAFDLSSIARANVARFEVK